MVRGWVVICWLGGSGVLGTWVLGGIGFSQNLAESALWFLRMGIREYLTNFAEGFLWYRGKVFRGNIGLGRISGVFY